MIVKYFAEPGATRRLAKKLKTISVIFNLNIKIRKHLFYQSDEMGVFLFVIYVSLA